MTAGALKASNPVVAHLFFLVLPACMADIFCSDVPIDAICQQTRAAFLIAGNEGKCPGTCSRCITIVSTATEIHTIRPVFSYSMKWGQCFFESLSSDHDHLPLVNPVSLLALLQSETHPIIQTNHPQSSLPLPILNKSDSLLPPASAFRPIEHLSNPPESPQ